jgi:hypothetical protein
MWTHCEFTVGQGLEVANSGCGAWRWNMFLWFCSLPARLVQDSNLWRTSIPDGEGRQNGEFVRTRVHTVRRAVRKRT